MPLRPGYPITKDLFTREHRDHAKLVIGKLISHLEPKGRILWQLDALHESLSAPTMQVKTGYVSRTTFYGCPAVLLHQTASPAVEAVIFLGRIPIGHRRLGFEGYFGTYYENRNFTNLDLMLIWEEGTGAGNRWNARVKIYTPWSAAAALQYQAEDGTFKTFETDRTKIDPVYIPDSRRGVGWNHFKLIADFDTKKYVKFIYNGNEWDLSDKALYNLTSVEAYNFHAEILYNKLAAPVLPLRSLVITCDEP